MYIILWALAYNVYIGIYAYSLSLKGYTRVYPARAFMGDFRPTERHANTTTTNIYYPTSTAGTFVYNF